MGLFFNQHVQNIWRILTYTLMRTAEIYANYKKYQGPAKTRLLGKCAKGAKMDRMRRKVKLMDVNYKQVGERKFHARIKSP